MALHRRKDRTMSQEEETRLWMGGMSIQFVKWTGHGLIYARVGSQETLANLTRSTVKRLLKDGTLVIEGYRPDWACPDDDEAGS
jgi:hypothetical protein